MSDDKGNGKAPLDDEIAKRMEAAATAELMERTIVALSTEFEPVALADACLSLYIGVSELQAQLHGKQLERSQKNAILLTTGIKQLMSSISEARKKEAPKSLIIT